MHCVQFVRRSCSVILIEVRRATKTLIKKVIVEWLWLNVCSTGRHFDLSKLKVTLDDVQRKPPSDVVDIDGTKSDYLFNPIYVGDIIDYVRVAIFG